MSKDHQKLNLSTSQSIWYDRGRQIWAFLCPLCQAQRRIPFKPKPESYRHFFQVALTASFFTLVAWKWFKWKGLVSVVPFWMIFETIYRWRARATLNCPQCGFDPYLFLIDEKWAKREVENHWRKKFEEKGIPYPEPNQKESPKIKAAPLEDSSKST